MLKNRIVFVSLAVVIALGCVSTRYKPPVVSKGEVLEEYNRQRSRRDSILREDFRVEVREDKKRFVRLTNLAFPVRLAATRLSDLNQLRTQFGLIIILLVA